MPGVGFIPATLDRRIAAGESQAKRESHGRRRRLYVALDDPPENGNSVKSGDAELAVAQERVRNLEEQVAVLQEQLERGRERNAELVNELRSPRRHPGPWWRLRQRERGKGW